MKVYVAGPYTLGDTAINVREAIQAGLDLLDAGHFPFVPHLTHFMHLVSARPYDVWIELDNTYLKVCDAVIRLAGESRGADAEVKLAESLGIPVFPSVGSFLTWAGKKR